MGKTSIEWTDYSWQVTNGCRSYSPGCANCYAETMSNRLAAMATADTAAGKNPGRKAHYLNVIHAGGWKGNVELVPESLTDPFGWKKPRKVFVNSTSDWFYGDDADRKFCEAKRIPFEPVPFDFIDKVFAVMALTPRHTYQILTKRPERMAEYMNEKWQPAKAIKGCFGLDIPAQVVGDDRYDRVHAACEEYVQKFGLCDTSKDELYDENGSCKAMMFAWPLHNVWLGTSVENQKAADERIPHLLKCQAAVRFLSCEPLLGPLEFSDVGRRSDAVSMLGKPALSGIHWLICGGESGPGARPMQTKWAEELADQCKSAGVAFFMKQMMVNGKLSKELSEFPESLRIRQYPKALAAEVSQ